MNASDSIFDIPVEQAVLVGVQQRGVPDWALDDALDELGRLTDTAGGAVMDRMVIKQDPIHPGTFIGSGKAERIAMRARELDARTVIFDEELSPIQGRNLERIVKCRVMDRTQLILDIFAAHARTKEGRLQVSLARMEYLLPRLRHMWTHLERQRGGIGVRGGPGEQQMEVDRRRIEERITQIRRELEQVRQRRGELRRGRRRHGWALIALVGYTNAGKSTLLNQLTTSHILADDKLFATLDPTTRKISLPNNQQALMTDTVGFITKLPHSLVDSFKATMEEVTDADLLVHVVDTSHPGVEHQIDAVNRVLTELDVGETTCIHAFNKIDIAGADRTAGRLSRLIAPSVAVSAKTGRGLDDLLHLIADRLRDRNQPMKLDIPLTEGKLISQLKSAANLLHEDYDMGRARMDARVPPHLVGACRPYEEGEENAS